MRIRGYEKAWAASAPGLGTAILAVVWWILGLMGLVTSISEEALEIALGIIIASALSSFGAYKATNSPRPPEDT